LTGERYQGGPHRKILGRAYPAEDWQCRLTEDWALARQKGLSCLNLFQRRRGNLLVVVKAPAKADRRRDDDGASNKNTHG